MMGRGGPDSLWKHKKTQGVYRAVQLATLQIADSPHDDRLMVIYESSVDHSLWVRPLDEFRDRFEWVADKVEGDRPRVGFLRHVLNYFRR